jgi:hypothetical protein
MTLLPETGGFADGLKRTVFQKDRGTQKMQKGRDTVFCDLA